MEGQELRKLTLEAVIPNSITMSAYSQQTAKRQKVREVKTDPEYFQGIDKIEYNNMATPNECSSYRFYNIGERVHNRPMDDWLKLSVSLTGFRDDGFDQYSRLIKCPWNDHTNSIDNFKRCIKAFFEFCSKLSLKYWTAFDTDLVPWSDNWDEVRSNWDDVAEYVLDLSQKYHLKLLWISPDLHSHPRYDSGAFTSNDATTFVQAATQIKKCLEMSQKLNAECFLLWPYREGYDTTFKTDVAKEIKLFAKLLKITAEYKDKLNYRCQLLIMPYYNYNFGAYFNCNFGSYTWQHSWRERDLIKMYMWDVTSCLYFLKNYNLDRYYKVCTPPGHHMYMANVYNMLGGVSITDDFDHCDNKNLTLMMKCILDQGTTPPGGVHLQLRPRRAHDSRELLTAHVRRVDACARALRHACAVAAEQIFAKHIQQKYASYHSGLGSRLVSSDVSMEEIEEYHKKNQSHTDASSLKSEHLDLVFQRYLDTSDHV